MSVRISIGGLCEQDLDLFFLEELVSNHAFRSWLLTKLPFWPDGMSELLAAERSVEHANGESDLVLTFGDSSGRQAKVLIENKIAAVFQSRQLLRYRERAAVYCERGDCVHASVVLLAPSGYAPRALAEVDAVVSYEQVEDYLSVRESDERVAYKLNLLRFAITKHGRGYNPEIDEAATAFWHQYWILAQSRAEALELKEPGPKTAGAGFVWFFPSRLPGDLNICHKLMKGFVDLHFPGWGELHANLREQLASMLEPDMDVVRAAKSAAVRLAAPKVNTSRSFADQRPDVERGLDAALRLFSWAQGHKDHILALAQTIA